MATCYSSFHIPDLSRPIASARTLSPSGELAPFNPAPATSGQVVGRRIDGLTASAGTYGMGGPGFFALRLGTDWLVVAVWGAASWMTCQGRLVEDMFHDTAGRPQPWIVDGPDGDALAPALVGLEITWFAVSRTSLRIGITGGADFTIADDPATRPVFAGNGQPRAFGPEDDLRRSVFISPTIELWV